MLSRRSRTTRWAACAALALSACTPQASKPPEARVNLTGFPPAFRDGYNAGCRSAQSLFNQRDDRRFASDRQYAAGWRDGYDMCKRKKAG
jgi:hypothetical protein